MKEIPRIAYLVDFRSGNSQTLNDYITAYTQHSEFRVEIVSVFNGQLPKRFDSRRYDAILIHYSIVLCLKSYLGDNALEMLAGFGGPKGVIIQDEYRFVHETWAALNEIGFNLLFTCIPPSEIENIYPEGELPGLKKIPVLTGYVPRRLRKSKVFDYASRKIDISYRGREVPWWLGEIGLEKSEIGRSVQKLVKSYPGLTTDIGVREEDRLYGKKWSKLLLNSKTVLGVESSASVVDFEGKIQTGVDRYLLLNPQATFEEVQQKFFIDEEDKYYIRNISPRYFETAGVGCLNILYEGDYSGVIQPWKHFVPLKKDHSNFDEVVDFLRDESRALDIIERSYTEIIHNTDYSFEALARKIDFQFASLLKFDLVHTSSSRSYATEIASSAKVNDKAELLGEQANYKLKQTIADSARIGFALKQKQATAGWQVKKTQLNFVQWYNVRQSALAHWFYLFKWNVKGKSVQWYNVKINALAHWFYLFKWNVKGRSLQWYKVKVGALSHWFYLFKWNIKCKLYVLKSKIWYVKYKSRRGAAKIAKALIGLLIKEEEAKKNFMKKVKSLVLKLGV